MTDARALLSQYGAETLLSEYDRWEQARTSVTAPNYVPPSSLHARTIITLDGIPGAGKSTTLRWLQPALGAEYLSMARFAETHGVTADERRRHQLTTGTAHPVDDVFIQRIADSAKQYILLEKFPRSVIEAATMLRAAQAHGWRLEVLHLGLPGDCVALSTRRQIERGPRRGRTPEPAHAEYRALTHLAHASSGRETLRSHGVPIHAFDMTRPQEENERAIRKALGLDAESLGWHRPTLEILADVADRLGIDAWASSGSVYRPFWNERLGPTQRPTDLDVAVTHDSEVEPLLQALEAAEPGERWSVLAPATRLRERYGLEVSSVAESKHFVTFLHRGGLVRLRNGAPELVLPPGAEACLRTGEVRLNERLLEALTPERRAEVLRKETHHLPRVLADYPGVHIAPETAVLLEGGPHWRNHTPKLVGSGFQALKAQVLAAPKPQRRAPAYCRRRLLPDERPIAEAILSLHRQCDFAPQAPRIPRKVPIRSNACFELLARDAGDAEFSAWFLEQAHHHQPSGGVDPDVRSVLDLSRFKSAVPEPVTELGPMHQGWPVQKHLAQSVLQLETDDVFDRARRSEGDATAHELRRCLRLAMLFHDVGKIVGPRPARHDAISASLFTRFRPAWLPSTSLGPTRWMIRCHDVLGRFTRWITEDAHVGYADAIDAQQLHARLREAQLPRRIAIACLGSLWRADLASISCLSQGGQLSRLVSKLASSAQPVNTDTSPRSLWST